MSRVSECSGGVWTLAEYGPGEQQRRQIELPCRELIVGRSADSDVAIPVKGVSKAHARLSVGASQLLVEDLGSTNGTYVNGLRVRSSLLMESDLVQFANSLFRVGWKQATSGDDTMEEGILPWAQTLLLFDQLLEDEAVVPNFQPIVRLASATTYGYELLARSDLEQLGNPALMFGAAERLGQQATLSELCRTVGMRSAARQGASQDDFFLNTHPSEVFNDRLVESLHALRSEHPDLKMTIEIHEGAVTNSASMRSFRETLNELAMKLSYDDFGAGQGRLVELGEVPPDVLKFDRQLVAEIDSAIGSRQEMLAGLVQLTKDLGVLPLAEGIETAEEHDTCRQLGFVLGQGYFYGRPRPFPRLPATGE